MQKYIHAAVYVAWKDPPPARDDGVYQLAFNITLVGVCQVFAHLLRGKQSLWTYIYW